MNLVGTTINSIYLDLTSSTLLKIVIPDLPTRLPQACWCHQRIQSFPCYQADHTSYRLSSPRMIPKFSTMKQCDCYSCRNTNSYWQTWQIVLCTIYNGLLCIVYSLYTADNEYHKHDLCEHLLPISGLISLEINRFWLITNSANNCLYLYRPV